MMRPGKLARGCLAIIDRYQRSHGAKVYDKRCRFEPSCCTFMDEAFRTRGVVIAFLLSAGRLMRCNPLTRPGSKDPVNRTRKSPRPNALRSIFAVALLSGMTVLIVASAAGAAITGGCTAFVRGRDVTTMTKSDPLVVHKGERVVVTGTHPGPASETFTTVIVDLWRPFFKISSDRDADGIGTTWSGSANVDEYMKHGSGLYRVAAGTFWGENKECVTTFYVEFRGGRTVEAAAGGLALVGAVGGAASGGRKKGVTLDDLGDTLDSDIKRDVPGIDSPTSPPKVDVEARYGVFTMCCAIPMLMAPVSAILGTMGGAGGTAGSGGEVLYAKTHYRRGHPILGFIFGLLFGLGGTIVLQQESVWTLDIWTGLVLPVGFAILGVIRGLIGRPYRVTVTR
jgi:putative component of membrane protein insertase Oxa1/YidC/SpoIIIJ protein YidD